MKPVSSDWHKVFWKLMGDGGFDPTPLQAEVCDWWFYTNDRLCLICGGEQAGKSYLTIALGGPLIKDGLYWIVGPDYNQPRLEFEYLHEVYQKGGLLKGEASMPQSGSQPWTMETKWGATIITKTSSDTMKLASFPVNGIFMTEAAQQLYEAFLKLRGRIAPTRGFMILSGTLERGFPWYPDMMKRWAAPNDEGGKSFKLPSWSNTHRYPEGRDDPEIKKLEATFPPDLFLERFGAEPRTLHGVVLPEFTFTTRHVRELELCDGVPVELAIDPGTNCYCVLFIQYIKPYVYVLDRIYERGAIDHDVIERAKAHPLFQHVTGGVIDIAGKHRNQGARSQVQLWQELTGVNLRYRYIFENDSIEVLRKHLVNDWLVFNANMTNRRAPDGTSLDVLAEPELWRWPDRTHKQNEARRPVDNNNHAMKATAYFCIDKTGLALTKRTPQLATVRRYF